MSSYELLSTQCLGYELRYMPSCQKKCCNKVKVYHSNLNTDVMLSHTRSRHRSEKTCKSIIVKQAVGMDFYSHGFNSVFITSCQSFQSLIALVIADTHFSNSADGKPFKIFAACPCNEQYASNNGLLADRVEYGLAEI